MQRAAALAQASSGHDATIVSFDTGGTAEGAARAATLAMKAGARIVIGPLLAGEVRAVTAIIAGRVPVLAFSNDERLRDSGAFLLGITATQASGAILGYARRRGVRRVVVLQSGSAWSGQVAAAAARLAGELGLTVAITSSADPAALRKAAGGELPDALFVADGDEVFVNAARSTDGTGVQLLGTPQAVDPLKPMPLGAMGSWIAAPDPDALADFAHNYEQRNGAKPGSIAALAYDAANIANVLRAAGRLDRSGLLQNSGFPAVTGAVRFREDGSATRELAILIGEATGFTAAPT